MARAALLWTRRRVAEAAGLPLRSVVRFERGLHIRPDEVVRMRHALESAGLDFLEEDGHGPGVRLRKIAPPAEGLRPEELSAANDG